MPQENFIAGDVLGVRIAFHTVLATFLIILFAALLPASSSRLADRQPIEEALVWVRHSPQHFVEYDYIMTARVRLLFFWAGKDDVGGGYIRRGVSTDDSRMDFIQVLFGSDPQKAPRAINRWGAGTEVSWHRDAVNSTSPEDVTTSAFFGFMKSSQGKSVGEMQSELAREKEHGEHAFTGILSRVEPSHAVSLVVPLMSDTDFNLHDYDRAEPLMLDHIASSSRPLRTLNGSARCSRAAAFLATVAELMDQALQGRTAPLSRCYIYDAQEDTLSLERVTPVPAMDVQLHGPNNVALLKETYHNLLQLDFTSTNRSTGKKVYFTIYAGTQGDLRGVPVQICYQPNWWFQVVLNLGPAKAANADRSFALR